MVDGDGAAVLDVAAVAAHKFAVVDVVDDGEFDSVEGSLVCADEIAMAAAVETSLVGALKAAVVNVVIDVDSVVGSLVCAAGIAMAAAVETDVVEEI